MAEKPPIQKPPVRGGYAPPPQPVQPVYQPVYANYAPTYPPQAYEPPPVTAPSTSFLAVLGWTSLIWAVGLILLCLLLRWLGSDDFGVSIANVSMYLSFIIIPIALLVGLFAAFEIGRETAGDAPKPTLLRFGLSTTLIVLGIIGQVGFSRYLTSSAAASLVERLAGVWERVDGPPPNQFGQFDAPMMKMESRRDEIGIPGLEVETAMDKEGVFHADPGNGDLVDPGHGPAEASSEARPDWTVEFTKGGNVSMNSPQGATQSRYEATGNRTFSVHAPTFQRTNLDGDFEIEFLSQDEIIITAASWFSSQSQLSGRYRRFGAPTIDPSVPEEFASDLQKLRAQLREYDAKSKALMSTQAQFERDRTKLTQELRDMGVQSATDINRGGKQSPIVKVKVDELLGLARNLKAVKTKRDDCELIIVKIQSALRQIDRNIALKKADVSELSDVSVLLATLKERMDETDDSQTIKSLNDQTLLEETLGQ